MGSASLAPHLLRLAEIKDGDRVLDLGCGTGSLIRVARSDQRVTDWVGIDPQPNAIARARQKISVDELALVVGQAEAPPFAGDAFDKCLSLLVLQEFEDVLRVVTEMVRVTRPGGSVAAYQWNYARMPIISSVVHVLSAMNSGPGIDNLPAPATAADLENSGLTRAVPK